MPIAVVLVALVLAVSAAPRNAAALSAPPAYVPVGPGDTYLALGDSLVTGYELPINADSLPGYPATLLQILKTKKPTITLNSLGIDGETSLSMLTSGQLQNAVAYITAQQAAGKVVSPVTLDIGGNDMAAVFLAGAATVTNTLTLFRADLKLILDNLDTALTVNGQRKGDLILMNLYNPYPLLTITAPPATLAPGQGPIITDLAVPLFNQVIAEEAAARGIPVADTYSTFSGRQPALVYTKFPYIPFPFNQANFDFHPRPAGHAVIAQAFANASGYVLPRIWIPIIQR
jgi:lysophospholipase L1-like esterase